MNKTLFLVVLNCSIAVTAQATTQNSEGTGYDFDFESRVCFEAIMSAPVHDPSTPAGARTAEELVNEVCPGIGVVIGTIALAGLVRLLNQALGQTRARQTTLTCDQSVLDALNRKKRQLCDTGKSSCDDHKLKDCAKVKKYYAKHDECIKIRQKITHDCYGNIPHPGHTTQENMKKQAKQNCVDKWNALGCQGAITSP